MTLRILKILHLKLNNVFGIRLYILALNNLIWGPWDFIMKVVEKLSVKIFFTEFYFLHEGWNHPVGNKIFTVL